MNREKLERAQKELQAPLGCLIIYSMDFIRKIVPEGAIVVEDPKTIKEWEIITDYHPERGIVVSSNDPHKDYVPGDILYLNGTRRERWEPLLHEGIIYRVIPMSDIIAKVNGPGAEEILEIQKISKTQY
jgi:hypothetical protein